MREKGEGEGGEEEGEEEEEERGRERKRKCVWEIIAKEKESYILALATHLHFFFD